MIIVWGTRLFGRIYVYNGMCVAIKFFHLWYIPIIPLNAYFVLETNQRQWRGVPVPFGSRYALQALGMAYLRGILMAAMVLTAIFAVISYGNEANARVGLAQVIVLITIAIICGLALLLSREFCVGSRDKLLEIAEHLGIRLNPAAIP